MPIVIFELLVSIIKQIAPESLINEGTKNTSTEHVTNLLYFQPSLVLYPAAYKIQ